MNVQANVQVSVVVPCYNAASIIGETIDSVLAQTFTDWEMIVIDDGSTDNSAEVVQAYSDPRICYYHIENQGVSYARNFGAAQAQAPLLAFLDSDDLWYPKRLEKMLAWMEAHPQCGAAYSRLDFLDEQGNKTGQVSTPLAVPLDCVELLVENRVCSSSNILTRKTTFDAVGPFREDMHFAEDQEWLFRVAYHPNWKVQGMMDCLMGYRASAGGLSAHLEEMYEGWQTMVAKVETYAPALVAAHKSHAKAIYFRYLARRALRLEQEKMVAWHYCKRALGADIAVLWTEPTRTLPTFVVALLRRVLSDKMGVSLLEILHIIPKKIP